MRLLIEAEDGAPLPAFAGPETDLLAFLSFAASEQYGALHPLTTVGHLLRTAHGIDLTPLLTFTSAEAEDAEDEQDLAMAWQEPAPLAAASAAVRAAFDADERLRRQSRNFPALPDRLDDLRAIAEAAAARGTRLRMLYRLDDDADTAR